MSSASPSCFWCNEHGTSDLRKEAPWFAAVKEETVNPWFTVSSCYVFRIGSFRVLNGHLIRRPLIPGSDSQVTGINRVKTELPFEKLIADIDPFHDKANGLG